MTFLFDRETALFPREDNQFVAECREIFQNPSGAAFGGWVAAVAARAVEEHPDCAAPIVSLQMSYLSAVAPGEVDIRITLLKSGASTQFWRAELLQRGAITNTADIVTSNRKPTDIDFQLTRPDANAMENGIKIDNIPMTPNWVATYEQYMVQGKPFSDNGSPDTMTWIKQEDGRPIDRISIVAICDTPMPRTFFLSDIPRMGSTVSMSTYIYASEEDIAAAGADHLLLRVSGATVRNSSTDQRVELWSKTGTLLATSNQIGFFR
ncbi:thioesterase family protein [Parasphingorhabdus litoris]|uniref:Thioesterase family protein n=1 Tax=Parasphingorhabdus litoris TaxID=394733 RepID=A0ABN1ATE6_9SPHN|nr:thioesterase family protein [Parasphingorhabdus litoris]